jgi:hypothetical protein
MHASPLQSLHTLKQMTRPRSLRRLLLAKTQPWPRFASAAPVFVLVSRRFQNVQALDELSAAQLQQRAIEKELSDQRARVDYAVSELDSLKVTLIHTPCVRVT